MEEPDTTVLKSNDENNEPSSSSKLNETAVAQDKRYTVSLVMNFNQDNLAVNDAEINAPIINNEAVNIDLKKTTDLITIATETEKIEEKQVETENIVENNAKNEVPLNLSRSNSGNESPSKKINKLISFFNKDAQEGINDEFQSQVEQINVDAVQLAEKAEYLPGENIVITNASEVPLKLTIETNTDEHEQIDTKQINVRSEQELELKAELIDETKKEKQNDAKENTETETETVLQTARNAEISATAEINDNKIEPTILENIANNYDEKTFDETDAEKFTATVEALQSMAEVTAATKSTSNENLKKEDETVLANIVEEPAALTAQTIEKVDINSSQHDSSNNSIKSKKSIDSISSSFTKANKQYPVDLNPFGSDDDVEDEQIEHAVKLQEKRKESLNPFDSSDDEIELEKSPRSSSAATTPSSGSGKVPPPRPPPPRISINSLGNGDVDASILRRTSLTSSFGTKTPVPTPRSNVTSSNTTPEATPRLSNRSLPAQCISDLYGSANSLNQSAAAVLLRNSELRGSSYSLTSNHSRSHKSRRAPAPPLPTAAAGGATAAKELFPSSESINGSGSRASTPTSSSRSTPKLGRKKRPAPPPPKPARLEANLQAAISEDNVDQSKNSLSYPLQGELESQLSDDEKALLEGKRLQQQQQLLHVSNLKTKTEDLDDEELANFSRRNSRRRIPLDKSILSDVVGDGEQEQKPHVNAQTFAEEEATESKVIYRRVIAPLNIDSPTHDGNPLMEKLRAQHDRQLEKLKDNKEAQNRNRQFTNINTPITAADINLDSLDSQGKGKKQKRLAPNLPIPPRKVLQMLPLQEIQHELEIIETQQQGLEKQGIVLEKMIRDRCEGENGELLNSKFQGETVGDGNYVTSIEDVQNSKEVEDLILQLFELVNEKNELFRRQAELMFLRRQHRLEQEHADLEYEIRVLMAQPERNKTDTDKAREKQLIERLVEVVQLRNDVIDSLEMDRVREVEEDMSIKERMEQHTSLRVDKGDSGKKSNTKLSKKEKKLSKSKKGDVDKDADETSVGVVSGEKQKNKKKKIKRLFFK